MNVLYALLIGTFIIFLFGWSIDGVKNRDDKWKDENWEPDTNTDLN